MDKDELFKWYTEEYNAGWKASADGEPYDDAQSDPWKDGYYDHVDQVKDNG